jgi:hypothetical protein
VILLFLLFKNTIYNMSIRNGVLTAILLLYGISADAQYRRRYMRYELNGGIGAVNMFGDIGSELKDFQYSQTRPALYVATRTDMNEQFSVKAGFFAGMMAGTDKGTKNDKRNYSYSGGIFELSGQIEWNFISTDAYIGNLLLQRRGLRGTHPQTRVYVFIGAGGVYSGAEVDTHDSQLSEGEYVKNGAVGLVVPYGLGIKSDINPEWAIGLEISRRNCTSDYIDGFTTKWSKKNDVYYFTSLHAIYKISFVGGKRTLLRRR